MILKMILDEYYKKRKQGNEKVTVYKYYRGFWSTSIFVLVYE